MCLIVDGQLRLCVAGNPYMCAVVCGRALPYHLHVHHLAGFMPINLNSSESESWSDDIIVL